MFYILEMTIILTSLLVFLIAFKPNLMGLVSIPNHRSSHIKPMPHGGGIGFIFSFLIGLLMLHEGFYEAHAISIIAIVLIFMLGIYDDYKKTSSKIKFSFIFLATIIIFYDGFRINNIGYFFGEATNIAYLSLPFTCFAIVGFTNAINLIDGIDGFSTVISIIILMGIGFVGYQANAPLVYKSSSILIAALTTFLIFNWNPAVIFMGDSGSLTLGFIIAILSIEIINYVNSVSVLFITAIPIFDTLTVMLRRKSKGLSILTADKNHMHHIVLRSLNGNVKKTVIMLGLVQLYFTLFGIFVAPHYAQEQTLIFFGLNLLAAYWGLGKLQDFQQQSTDFHNSFSIRLNLKN